MIGRSVRAGSRFGVVATGSCGCASGARAALNRPARYSRLLKNAYESPVTAEPDDASQPPAPDLAAVVDFYNKRFNIGFTEQERDLVAFLRTLWRPRKARVPERRRARA
jgi:hypothetical protein